jgi:hypothetical protein
MQHGTVRNLESLSNILRRFKWGFPNDAQNGGVNLVKRRPSRMMLVMDVLPSSGDLPDPESNGSQSGGSPSEVHLKFYEDLVRVKAFIGEKFDDDPLFQFMARTSERILRASERFYPGYLGASIELLDANKGQGGLSRPGF